jgi:hypothetical protein
MLTLKLCFLTFVSALLFTGCSTGWTGTKPLPAAKLFNQDRGSIPSVTTVNLGISFGSAVGWSSLRVFS